VSFPISLNNNAADGLLTIDWDDGTQQRLRNTMLRKSCMCADCRALRLRSGVELVVDAQTKITDIRMVGQYAAQIIFSDGHARGIFPWQFLKDLSDEE
jgi:DUF971 family protein